MQFQIVSNTVTTHVLETLFSFLFSAVTNCFKYRQNALISDIVFKRFSTVPNRFKYRQNVLFRGIVFNKFSAVANRLKNIVRMHA